MYWKYFKYVVEHKVNVGIECLKMGLFVHAITHDLSKFLPSEFFPYARFFMNKNRAKEYRQSDDFQTGWCHHQNRNKHHWNYWVSVTRKDELVPLPMPGKYVMQMIADWRGMSRKFGGSAEKYYDENKYKMILHNDTIQMIEHIFTHVLKDG